MTVKAVIATALLSSAATYCLQSHLQHKTMADYPHLAKYREANQRVQPGATILFGDSITDNWARSLQFPAGYVGRGVRGQTTSQMLLRFRQDVIDLRPQTVVILAGTNDVMFYNNGTRTEQAAANIETMADLAKAHGIQVVLCSIPPMNHKGLLKTVDFTSNEFKLNSELHAYANQRGLAFVDYYNPMSDGTGKMKPGISIGDGIHPNDSGYVIMRGALDQSLGR